MFIKIGNLFNFEIFNKYKNSNDTYVFVQCDKTKTKYLFTQSLFNDGLIRVGRNPEDIPKLSIFNCIYNFIFNNKKTISNVIEIENTQANKKENAKYYYFRVIDRLGKITPNEMYCLMFTERELKMASDLYTKHSDKFEL